LTPSARQYTELVQHCERLADIARNVAMKYYSSPHLNIEDKLDSSPVTQADLEIEDRCRDYLGRVRPRDGFLGEETGASGLDKDIVWVIDPIDGTQAFATGKPLFGTLVAVVVDGRPLVALLENAPLKERVVGISGLHTHVNRRQIQVRPPRPLSESVAYTANPEMFIEENAELFSFVKKSFRWTLYNADCYAYGMLARGHIDLVFEQFLKPHDFCALVPIVEGAGGKVTDFAGNDLTIHSDGRILAGSAATCAKVVERASP